MKYLIALPLVALLSFIAVKEERKFPALEGITLDDENVKLPEDVKGKYTLLGMASSKKAEDHLNTWAEPIYLKFIYKPEKPQLFQTSYDANVYFIPMFTGAKAAVEKAARKHAINHIDPSLHHYVLFYKGDMKTYKNALKMTEKNEPYFFLLDEEGNIVYETKGIYTEEKMTKIESILQEAGY